MGSILCNTSAVTDSMVEASSLGLADSLTEEEREFDLLYPRLERIREISAFIAMRVIRKAQAEVHGVHTSRIFPRVLIYCFQGVDRQTDLRKLSDDELLRHVVSKMWSP